MKSNKIRTEEDGAKIFTDIFWLDSTGEEKILDILRKVWYNEKVTCWLVFFRRG